MRALFRENFGEAIVGVLVVILAVWFVVFAWNRTGGGAKAGSIHVTAIFPNASGVTAGTDVRVAGLKIGSVTCLALDPQSYQVKVEMAIDPQTKLPADSSASITSEGLLGSTFIAFTPGGSPASVISSAVRVMQRTAEGCGLITIALRVNTTGLEQSPSP